MDVDGCLVSVHREGVNPSSMDGVSDLRDHNSIGWNLDGMALCLTSFSVST